MQQENNESKKILLKLKFFQAFELQRCFSRSIIASITLKIEDDRIKKEDTIGRIFLKVPYNMVEIKILLYLIKNKILKIRELKILVIFFESK